MSMLDVLDHPMLTSNAPGRPVIEGAVAADPGNAGLQPADAAVWVTDRQYAILRGLASGLTIIQIAARMDRSTETVNRCLLRLRATFGAATNAQALDRAWRLGLLNAQTPPLAHERPLPTAVKVTHHNKRREARRAG